MLCAAVALGEVLLERSFLEKHDLLFSLMNPEWPMLGCLRTYSSLSASTDLPPLKP